MSGIVQAHVWFELDISCVFIDVWLYEFTCLNEHLPDYTFKWTFTWIPLSMKSLLINVSPGERMFHPVTLVPQKSGGANMFNRFTGSFIFVSLTHVQSTWPL